MFGALLTLLVTLMHLYVCWRLWSLPGVRRWISRRAFVTVAALVWAAGVAGRIWGHDGEGAVAAVAELLAMDWLGVLLLMTVSLLAVDLLSGFGLWLRRRLSMLRTAGLTVGALLSVVAMVQGTRAPVIQQYEARIDGLPTALEGRTLVVLSDLHLGAQLGRRWLDGRVDQVSALKPDLVLLLGDLFEGHGLPSADLLPGLRRLTAPLGVWAILGNHEFHGAPEAIAALLEAAGIRVLRNARATPLPGLTLVGVENPTHSRVEARDRDALVRLLSEPTQGAVILLSHAPRHDDTASTAGVDLMLAGHTHGGQIWPFGYLVATLFPRYEGHHRIDGMNLIVSRGAGTWGPRMRLWRPAEILRVTLKRG